MNLLQILGQRGDIAAANQPAQMPDMMGASGMAWNSGFGRSKIVEEQMRKLAAMRQAQLQATATRNVPGFMMQQMGRR